MVQECPSVDRLINVEVSAMLFCRCRGSRGHRRLTFSMLDFPNTIDQHHPPASQPPKVSSRSWRTPSEQFQAAITNSRLCRPENVADMCDTYSSEVQTQLHQLFCTAAPKKKQASTEWCLVWCWDCWLSGFRMSEATSGTAECCRLSSSRCHSVHFCHLLTPSQPRRLSLAARLSSV